MTSRQHDKFPDIIWPWSDLFPSMKLHVKLTLSEHNLSTQHWITCQTFSCISGSISASLHATSHLSVSQLHTDFHIHLSNKGSCGFSRTCLQQHTQLLAFQFWHHQCRTHSTSGAVCLGQIQDVSLCMTPSFELLKSTLGSPFCSLVLLPIGVQWLTLWAARQLQLGKVLSHKLRAGSGWYIYHSTQPDHTISSLCFWLHSPQEVPKYQSLGDFFLSVTGYRYRAAHLESAGSSQTYFQIFWRHFSLDHLIQKLQNAWALPLFGSTHPDLFSWLHLRHNSSTFCLLNWPSQTVVTWIPELWEHDAHHPHTKRD